MHGVQLQLLVEKILRYLGAWHHPLAGLSPPSTPETYTYEACQSIDI